MSHKSIHLPNYPIMELKMELSKIKNIAVIGSGIMGHGIGQAFVWGGGYEVNLNDISDALLDKAVQQIRSNLNTFVEFGIITPEGAKEALSRIKTNKNFKEAARESDFVLEALPEVMDLKKCIFKELDEYRPSHTIIASNTSGLSRTEMTSEIKRQDQVVIFENEETPVPFYVTDNMSIIPAICSRD